MDTEQLTDTDKAMLDLERSWWQYPGRKEQAVREQFDLSMTQFYQRVNAIVDTQAALAFDPLLVKRLRKLRGERQASRSASRLGFEA